MKLLMITPWATACGIATYSKNLINALEDKHVEVEVFSDTQNFNKLTQVVKQSTAQIVHIQHEFGISLPADALLSLLGKFRSVGKKIVITTHTEESSFNVILDGVADVIILHNDPKKIMSKNTFSKFMQIPHGIPEVHFEHNKSVYRKKYNIPEAFVIGTCGFLSPQRVEWLEQFLYYAKDFIRNNNVYIHLATSSHRADTNDQYAQDGSKQLCMLAERLGFKDKIHICTTFMETEEFRERIHTFDVGISYMDPTVVSNSGTAADMISCGVPVVANDSHHFSHLKKYISICTDFDDMVCRCNQLYGDQDLYTEQLEKATDAIEDLGFSKIAKRHLAIYEDLLNTNIVKETPIVSKESNWDSLNKDEPITITCPNSIAQILSILNRLQSLTAQGFSYRFVVQNTGTFEPSILPHIMPEIESVHYADVQMDKEDKELCIFPTKCTQQMAIDYFKWRRLREVRSDADVLPFIPYVKEYEKIVLPKEIVAKAKDILSSIVKGKCIHITVKNSPEFSNGLLNTIVEYVPSNLGIDTMLITHTTRYSKENIKLNAELVKALVGRPDKQIQLLETDTLTQWAIASLTSLTITDNTDLIQFCGQNEILFEDLRT